MQILPVFVYPFICICIWEEGEEQKSSIWLEARSVGFLYKVSNVSDGLGAHVCFRTIVIWEKASDDPGDDDHGDDDEEMKMMVC